MPPKNTLKILAFSLGITSVIAQILLLRELVSVFYGNETAYAIILSSWLFWVSLGSFIVSRFAQKIINPFKVLHTIQWLIALLLPPSIIAVRLIKYLLGVQTGEMVGVMGIFWGAFIVLAPLTFLIGAFFTLLCSYGDHQESEIPTLTVRSIYLFESIGAAFGGLIFSFVLIHFMPALHLAVLLSVINLAMFSLTSNKERVLFKISLISILLILSSLASGLIGQVDRKIREMQWCDFNLVESIDTIYGNIALVKNADVYSIYENGLLSSSTEDKLSSEESVHYPLLEHPLPKRVLLLGGGLTGSIHEILKHPVDHVDYVELDPALIGMARKYLPNQYLEPLKDKRVSVRHADGKLFIKKTNERYDVVIINLADPTTALINRYYSLEFFKEMKRVLTEGAVISLSVSSSENYLSEEARLFLRSINSTLKRAFTDVVSIPGENNIFLACNRKGALTLNSKELINRLKERNIQTSYVREYYLPYSLTEERINYINDILKEEGQINTDAHPVAYLFDSILWSTHFNTGFKEFMARILWIKPYHLLPLGILLLIIGIFIRRKRPTFSISLSIMTTGFSEIIFQVIVILAFQTLYGYAYYKIGLIIASFMAGLVLGSLAARPVMQKAQEKIVRIYQYAQAAIVIYPLLLLLLISLFKNWLNVYSHGELFATLFAILPIIAGFIGGLQYPLAAHLAHYINHERQTAPGAGFLYAADVLGAAIGSLLTGAVLIPLWGINAVACVCAGLNAIVFVLLLLIKKNR